MWLTKTKPRYSLQDQCLCDICGIGQDQMQQQHVAIQSPQQHVQSPQQHTRTNNDSTTTTEATAADRAPKEVNVTVPTAAAVHEHILAPQHCGTQPAMGTQQHHLQNYVATQQQHYTHQHYQPPTTTTPMTCC